MHHFGQGYDGCFKTKARDTGEYAYHITPDPKRGGVVILDDSADERAGDKEYSAKCSVMHIRKIWVNIFRKKS
jgi:hypothetical protein